MNQKRVRIFETEAERKAYMLGYNDGLDSSAMTADALVSVVQADPSIKASDALSGFASAMRSDKTRMT